MTSNNKKSEHADARALARKFLDHFHSTRVQNFLEHATVEQVERRIECQRENQYFHSFKEIDDYLDEHEIDDYLDEHEIDDYLDESC